jgi:hypothetical protein
LLRIARVLTHVVFAVTFQTKYFASLVQLPVRLLKGASDGEWLHDGTLECPACSSICSDCSKEGRELKVPYLLGNLNPRPYIVLITLGEKL